MVSSQKFMLLLESFKHGCDELHIGVPNSCMNLIRGSALPFCRPPGIDHVILQLARVCMHLLQELTPAQTAGCSECRCEDCQALIGA